MPSIKISIHMPKGSLRTSFSIRLKKNLEKESASFFTYSKVVFLNGSLGDFNGMLENMIRCGIIDHKLRWILGDGHAVITGNCLDGSENSVRMLWLLYALESKAIRAGGYLHFLPGPSDIRHSLGSWRSEQPFYASPRKNSVNQYAVLFDGNNELFRWLKTKNILEKIGNTVVVQSSLSEELEDYLPRFRGKKFPEGVREILRLSLDTISSDHLIYLHETFDTPWLLVVDAGSGTVKLSEHQTSETNLGTLPLLYQNGAYHSLHASVESAI